MAESWGDICRQCVAVVADVPASVLLGTVLATALGVFVLVSRSPLAAPGARDLNSNSSDSIEHYEVLTCALVIVLPVLIPCRAGTTGFSARRKEV